MKDWCSGHDDHDGKGDHGASHGDNGDHGASLGDNDDHDASRGDNDDHPNAKWRILRADCKYARLVLWS